MPTNVEIKARARLWNRLRERIEALAGPPTALLYQEDTFFPCPRGRLKLRITASDQGELIYYQRPDTSGPKVSQYSITRSAEPSTLREVLSAALGVLGVVRKQRWLYWLGQTRVHLDQVECLGGFVELEVVLKPGQSLAEGRHIAEGVMTQLQIEPADLIEGAYLDLLTADSSRPQS